MAERLNLLPTGSCTAAFLDNAAAAVGTQTNTEVTSFAPMRPRTNEDVPLPNATSGFYGMYEVGLRNGIKELGTLTLRVLTRDVGNNVDITQWEILEAMAIGTVVGTPLAAVASTNAAGTFDVAGTRYTLDIKLTFANAGGIGVAQTMTASFYVDSLADLSFDGEHWGGEATLKICEEWARA